MKNYNRREWIFRIGVLSSLSFVSIWSHAAKITKICGFTPRQVLGPFYPEKWIQGDSWEADLTLVPGAKKSVNGNKIVVQGKVLDSKCRPVAGAKVQLWQANSHGRYRHKRDDGNSNLIDPGFTGSAQVITNKAGQYLFKTIMPGTYDAAPGWTRPAHLHFKVIQKEYEELVTQMYFAGGAHQSLDPILGRVPDKDRSKLIVKFKIDKKKQIKIGIFNFELKNANSFV